VLLDGQGLGYDCNTTTGLEPLTKNKELGGSER
jgi:hypothetical protein